MRAHDFLTERSIKVEIPINITIPQDGSDPQVSVDDESSGEDSEAQKVMVSPLKKEIEMAKASQGKESPVIDELTDDDEEVGEDDDMHESDELKQLQSILRELG